MLSIILFMILEFTFLEYFDVIHSLKRKSSLLTATLLFIIFGILSNWKNIYYFFNFSIKTTYVMYHIGVPVFILFIIFRPLAYSVILKKVSKKIIATSYTFLAVSNIFESIATYLLKENVSLEIWYIILPLSELFVIGGGLLLIRKLKLSDSLRSIIQSLRPLYVVLILIFIIFYDLFIYSTLFINKISKFMVWGTFFTIPLIVFLILKISVTSKKHEETAILLEKQLENQTEYYKKINNIYTEFRSFRHDYKNHIMCLRNLIAENNIEEAVEYLNDLSLSADNKQKYYDTGNNMINALITDKNEKAVSCNAKIAFYGAVPDSGIKNIDLCTIFSNALDNAIEACEKDNSGSEKIITVDSKYNQGIYFLTVSNPYFDSIILDNNGNISTSKANKTYHGFGLSNIKKAVKKYDGHTETDDSNNIFKLNIDITMKME